MSAIPLAQYLSEFDQRTRMPQPVEPSARRQPVFEHLTLVPDNDAPGAVEVEKMPAAEAAAPVAAPAPDAKHVREIDAAREKAFCDGRASMQAEMEAVFAETLREEREKAAAAQAKAIEAARKGWTAEEADRMVETFRKGLGALEDNIRVSLSSVLRPVATAARRRQSVAELVEAVRTMTMDGRPFRMVASGPKDLLAQFADKLGAQRGLVTFEPAEDAGEIRIEADRTIIETRLASWRRALEEALS